MYLSDERRLLGDTSGSSSLTDRQTEDALLGIEEGEIPNSSTDDSITLTGFTPSGTSKRVRDDYRKQSEYMTIKRRRDRGRPFGN